MNKLLRKRSGSFGSSRAHRIAAFLLWQLLAITVSYAASGYTADTVIKGKVTDHAGESLPGVNVLVKGTALGTTTDINGQYSLEVPDNAILQFSYIGYKTAEVTVGDQTVIDIGLELDSKGLEEVVVVGYGTQKKVNMTGAVDQAFIRGERSRLRWQALLI